MRLLYLILMIILLSRCASKEIDIEKVLYETVRACDDMGSTFLYYMPSPEDVRLNKSRTPREHLIFASKYFIPSIEDMKTSFDMEGCTKIVYLEEEIEIEYIQNKFDKRKFSLVNLDTIVYDTQYRDELGRSGKTGIFFFISPVKFICEEARYVVSGIKWKRSEALYLFKIQNEHLEFVKSLHL